MAPTSNDGRRNRMSGPKTPVQVADAWGRAQQPWIPATQTPASLAPMEPGQVSPGGVQTGGDYMSPQQSPYPYNQQPGPEQTHRWWSAEDESDTLIHRDRNGYFQTGTERTGRVSSMPDPPASGPAMPSFKAVNVTWNWQVGTGSAYMDDLSRPYTWVGQQDGSWSQVLGGTPGFYRDGPGGPPVDTQPVDGPQRIYGGPPHGLHTWSPPDYAQTLSRYNTVPQMVAARVDRLSNSQIAGQSFSQTTQHQGGGPAAGGGRGSGGSRRGGGRMRGGR
jgi:hypothetical protein